MTDSNRRMTHAALVAALIASPALAANDPAALEQQLDALQQALSRQQEQLAQQQQEIERLRQQLDAMSSGGAAVEQIADEVQQAKLAAQDAPRAAMTSARPTISSADGRSSIALRSVVQLDAAAAVTAQARPAAGQFIDFLQSSAAQNAFEKYGFQKAMQR